MFGVTDYDDEDEFFTPDDDIRALHYAIARLRWSDVLDFALSFHSLKVQWEALRGASLKGIVYQTDILAFLAHPTKRIQYARLDHRDYENGPMATWRLRGAWRGSRSTGTPGR